jgi:hypothetical protein
LLADVLVLLPVPFKSFVLSFQFLNRSDFSAEVGEFSRPTFTNCTSSSIFAGTDGTTVYYMHDIVSSYVQRHSKWLDQPYSHKHLAQLTFFSSFQRSSSFFAAQCFVKSERKSAIRTMLFEARLFDGNFPASLLI